MEPKKTPETENLSANTYIWPLVRQVLSGIVRRAPWLILRAVGVGFLVGLVLWAFIIREMPAGGHIFAGLAYLPISLFAGFVAGVALACKRAAEDAVNAISSTILRLSNDQILNRIAQLPLSDRGIPIDEVRRKWDETTENLKPEKSVRWFNLTRRLSSYFSRFALGFLRWMVVDEFLAKLEAEGETHVTMPALTKFVQSKAVGGVVDLIEGRIRFFCAIALGFSTILLLVPVLFYRVVLHAAG